MEFYQLTLLIVFGTVSNARRIERHLESESQQQDGGFAMIPVNFDKTKFQSPAYEQFLNFTERFMKQNMVLDVEMSDESKSHEASTKPAITTASPVQVHQTRPTYHTFQHLRTNRTAQPKPLPIARNDTKAANDVDITGLTNWLRIITDIILTDFQLTTAKRIECDECRNKTRIDLRSKRRILIRQLEHFYQFENPNVNQTAEQELVE